MKQLLRKAYNLSVLFGVDPLRTIHTMKALPLFFRDLRTLSSQIRTGYGDFPFGALYPCLDDRFAGSGTAKGHYFHQDLLVARKIHANNPARHIDVGSRVDGFVAHVAAFRSIEVIDIRPSLAHITNVSFLQADFMSTIQDDLVECCDSLSCLHALEHFGLGRYGDTIDSDGYLHGLNNLYRALKPGGKFYFSVPIGPQRIEFNAHRVFAVNHLLALFEGKYVVDQFSYVDDLGDLHENAPLTTQGAHSNFDCNYGCGIFEMTKL